MPPITAPDPRTTPQLEFKSYSEDIYFRAAGKPEPNSRSQTLIYHYQDRRWWIKVTFAGSVILPDAEAEQTKPTRERRNEFQDFVRLIDFHTMPLLDDTVTEAIISEDQKSKTTEPVILYGKPKDTNRFANIAKHLQFYVQEDPLRVDYPLRLEFPSFRAIDAAELREEHEINSRVFRILYMPHDSEVIQAELENLERFNGVPGIVQSAGIAVISNPYATSQTNVLELVISGILFEYYSGGTLECVLNEQRVREHRWERWALQIGTALRIIHNAKKFHMDIKPSNVVLDRDGNAILIDISGIGGQTYEWLAPEILAENGEFDHPFEDLESNDVWAYGKLLDVLASNAGDSPFTATLKFIAEHLTEEKVQRRWTLSQAISYLNTCKDTDQSKHV
ncbi:hypothetical protein PENANT_c002G09091 [Penicillium antarcticum]|uniref:Protein kinase domain-containing protein n=1 Tax=Penicillium antarcticum TaxID=416450 RepID=A0A1V6QL79_9EURO|nr:hypothetical protein PENANT_c002G09091 [Penicillium antarcticum]